jgi:mandelate racemase
MADAMKIGGVTGWMRAAAIAHTAGLPLSSHLFPEISVHLLASSPTAHWLEYVDFAEPILRAGVTIRDGSAIAPDGADSGVVWDESAVRKYAVA